MNKHIEEISNPVRYVLSVLYQQLKRGIKRDYDNMECTGIYGPFQLRSL